MRNWNRREFTRNTLMLTLFSPFIELLEPKLAKAQTRPGNAKYLLIVTSNGTEPGVWNPAGSSPGSITFSTMTQPLSKVRRRRRKKEKAMINAKERLLSFSLLLLLTDACFFLEKQATTVVDAYAEKESTIEKERKT